MTTAEAAELLGIKQSSVVRLINKKVLKAKKTGPIFLIERKSVEAYAEKVKGLGPHDPRRKSN